MQTILTYLALLFTGLVMQAQTNTIEVSITAIDSNDGNIKVGLYNDSGTFLSKIYKGDVAKISENKAKSIFENIPDGIYAVSIFHDENDNDQFDMFMGMFPKEDYGCSNGATGTFGPPKWNDAKFEIKGGEVKQVEINL